MKVLLKGIVDEYEGNAALVTALPGGLYLNERPQFANVRDDLYPYAVFFIVSERPVYTFTEIAENALIQFNIWDNSESVTTVADAFSALIACFDLCTLSVTGYSSIYMVREFNELFKVDDVWQYSVTYRLEIQKTR